MKPRPRIIRVIGGVVVVVLLGLSVAGSMFVDDSISAMSAVLKRELRLSDTWFGVLSSAYSFLPLLGITLLGGLFIDKAGTRAASLVFALVNALGAAALAIAADSIARPTPRFAAMVCSFALYGAGGECLAVAVSSSLAEWFPSLLSVATAGTTVLNRAASIVAFNVSASIAQRQGVREALFLMTIVCMAQLFFNFIRVLVDHYCGKGGLTCASSPQKIHPITEQKPLLINEYSDKKQELDKPSPKCSNICSGLGVRYWLLLFDCFAFWLCWMFAQFAPLFISSKFKRSPERAASIFSIAGYAPLASPLFGFAVDLFGKRSTCLVATFSCLLASHLVLLLAPPSFPPEIPVCVLGIAFALFASSLFPSVPLVVPPNSIGRAYGVFQVGLDGACVVSPLLYGLLHDVTGSYSFSELMLCVVALLGIFASSLLWVIDSTKYGGVLQLPKQKK